MADEEKAATSGKRKAIIAIAGLLTVEAVVIVGAMLMFMGGEPQGASADFHEADPAHVADERVTEVNVLKERLSNARSGVTYLYDTEIHVQVKKKHEERVTDELAQFNNEIRAEIAAIWRTSDPENFQEPRLENLNRKIHALLDERFGVDAEDGEPILVKCVIVMGTGFRIHS